MQVVPALPATSIHAQRCRMEINTLFVWQHEWLAMSEISATYDFGHYCRQNVPDLREKEQMQLWQQVPVCAWNK